MNGTTLHTDKEKATALNNFFVSVFTKEDASTHPTVCNRERENPTLTDINLSKDDIEKRLLKLNITKSAGPDGLHPRLLKETATSISTPLLSIFRKSIDNGKVPSAWKKASITPIYKKGSRKEVGNYRPVSLTAICCKLLESIVRQAVNEHMTKYNLLSAEQHGFTEGKSCVTQLVSVMESWTEILDKHGCIDVVYFDFQKAFDTVPHKRLLHKIKNCGIQGKVCNWIKSFLTDREQRVAVNGDCSEWVPVTSGVPQGSVLGPTLFVIYINDLPDAVHSCIKLFADDTKIYRHINSTADCQKIQDDIHSLESWSKQWLLKFHPQKCKVMRIGNGHPEYHYSMTDNTDEAKSVTLQETPVEKDLGIYVDKDLNYKEHIHKSITKANQTLGMIRRTFQYIDRNIFISLYKSRVRPVLEYGNTIWSPRHKKDIQAVEKVQQRATKLVPGLKDLDYTARLKILKLPSLSYRRDRGDMIETFKYIENIYKTENPWFIRDHTKNTRDHSKKLCKLRCNTELRKHCFSHRIINTM